MPARNRSRTVKGSTGSGTMTYTLSGTVLHTDNNDGFEYCNDIVHEGNGKFFETQKIRQTGGVLNGNGNFGIVWNNYRCDAMQDVTGFVRGLTQGVPGAPSLGALATMLLARTTPSRPVVDLPIAVYELKDIPSMLRLEGDSFLRKAASANLSYQFGWAPLLSDLSKLLSFQDEVSKRETELRNLFDSGLRRKARLWDGSITHTQNRFAQSDGGLIGGSWKCDEAIEYWGFVNWYPTILPPRTAAEMRSLARRAVLGLTVDLSTAWNAIPWTWLADWCTNIGQFLAAQRNIIPCSHSLPQIMQHYAFEAYCDFPVGINVTRHQCWLEQKNRFPQSPSLSAHLPYLSLRQLSILGSIGVTRRAPRS